LNIFEILRWVFLGSLVLTIFFYRLRFGGPGLPWLMEALSNILVLVGGLATTALFFILLFRIDPLPYIRLNAYYTGLEQLVNFDNAIPSNLTENLAVAKVDRLDTDGDEFKEWVVLYSFDTRAKSSPLQAVVYDNDRGNPPVIFPYALQAPDRNYLAEEALDVTVTVEPLAKDTSGPNQTDVDEIVILSKNELTIFRFKQNSEIWDFPRDVPPRYRPIGFFRGNGNVKLDRTTKRVTVNDRNGYERSQLALRSVYILRVDPQTGFETYLDPIQPLGGSETPRLAAPLFATIDFFPTPPDDIFNTPYPEKIVLAFYTATCAAKNDTLCNSFKSDWPASQFLAGEALSNFQSGTAGYFGLAGLSDNQEILVSQVRYFPQVETDPDRLESGGGRDVVTGEQAQEGLVEIAFTANGGARQTVRYDMKLVGTQQGAQWKIVRRVPETPPTPVPPPSLACTVVPEIAELNGGQAPVTLILDSGDAGSYQFAIASVSVVDFGDGSQVGPPEVGAEYVPEPGLPATITHTYTNPGTYQVSATAKDNSGRDLTYRCTASVRAVSLNPVAEADGPYNGWVCRPITFSAAGSSDPSGSPLNYVWEFGDGSPAEQSASPTHLYAAPGVYTATLKVTNATGQSTQDSATVTVAVAPQPPPKCGPAPCCH
jgi:hypothetical protein